MDENLEHPAVRNFIGAVHLIRKESRSIYAFFLFVCSHVGSWHRPFCVDLQEATFLIFRLFLERYCDGFDASEPPPPFPSKA